MAFTTFLSESLGAMAARLPGFAIETELGNAEAAAFAAANEWTALVLKHLGSACATSPVIAASATELVGSLPNVPVAVPADSEEVDVVRAALQCGVRGYLPTNLQSAVVVEAVRLVCAGDMYAPVACLLGQPSVPQPRIETAARPTASPSRSAGAHRPPRVSIVFTLIRRRRGSSRFRR
jgi:DNA-binding NarL/FixJ family response regulator